MDKFEMPVGLGMALAQNPEAMQKFSSLTDKQKWEVVSGTHAVEIKKRNAAVMFKILLQLMRKKILLKIFISFAFL